MLWVLQQQQARCYNNIMCSSSEIIPGVRIQTLLKVYVDQYRLLAKSVFSSDMHSNDRPARYEFEGKKHW